MLLFLGKYISVTVPDPGSITDHLKRFKPKGWMYNGVMHLLPGVTLEDAEGGMFQFMGRVVDSEGNVLKEAQEVPDWEDDDES
jgi:hypothetical protein